MIAFLVLVPLLGGLALYALPLTNGFFPASDEMLKM